MKLGLLVAACGVLAGVLELYGVLRLGMRPRCSLALAVLISLVISRLLGHGMTAPLRQMTAAAGNWRAVGRPRRSGPAAGTRWVSWPRSTSGGASCWPTSGTSCAPRWRQVRTARGPGGCLIEVLVEPAGLVVHADPDRLGQVLTNLVDNAARHAPGDGLVQVRAVSDNVGGLVLEVTDNGPGIARERWETVFQRFCGGTGEIAVIGPEQAAGGKGTDGGTGLGLAIARWAVVPRAGRIAVVPVESGCRIRVEIPPPAG